MALSYGPPRQNLFQESGFGGSKKVSQTRLVKHVQKLWGKKKLKRVRMIGLLAKCKRRKNAV